jgi:uncharacterized DUF497 family protein
MRQIYRRRAAIIAAREAQWAHPHMMRGDAVRVIPLRKANRRERRRYEQKT